jgi:hypothetical protein
MEGVTILVGLVVKAPVALKGVAVTIKEEL